MHYGTLHSKEVSVEVLFGNPVPDLPGETCVELVLGHRFQNPSALIC